tara:strand:- start:4832 stop:5353 length:522 start_codon:yes stop_codon:yes gene_type:complete
LGLFNFSSILQTYNYSNKQGAMDMFSRKLLIPFIFLFCSNAIADGHKHVVKMLNMGQEGPMVFEPSYIKIKKGDIVVFEMTDKGHNAASITFPTGGPEFDTQYAPSTEVKFDVEGIYFYKCTPHAIMGMAGFIEVGNTSNKDEMKVAVDKFESGVMMPNAKGRMLKAFEANVK